MRQLTFRALVGAMAFTLGSVAGTLWPLKHFSRSDSGVPVTNVGEASPAEWKKVSFDGKATFRVPPHLRPRTLSTSVPYRAFRREEMEVTLFLNGIGGSGPCIAHADKKLRRYEISRIKVG